MERKANNPADPWSIDYFNPPTPNIHAPSPRRWKTPHDLPDVDRLFAAQDDLNRAINSLSEVEDGLRGQKEPHGLRTLRVNLQNAYKVINRYLREFASPTGGGQFE